MIYNFAKAYNYEKGTKMLFELEMAPPYTLYSSKKDEDKRPQQVMLTPEIRIRLLNKFSGPVVTPSYLMHIRYLRGSRPGAKLHPSFIALSLNHHSNGQQGHIIKSINGVAYIDTLGGNFSTHYLNIYYFKSFLY